MKKGNLIERLTQIKEHWQPHIIAEVNGTAAKLVKAKGEFVWHKHDQEDELFLILKGELRINFRDHELLLKQGDYVMIPHGVEHQPVARQEVHLLLIEPASTLNTGDAPASDLTNVAKRL
jgi:mannose-6-phosphate isomerase-like protein (cupin superfamily)